MIRALAILLLLATSAQAAGPLCGQLPNHACVVNVKGQAGIDCTGASDSTSGLQTVATANPGATLFLPSGCVVGFATPTSGTCANGARAGLTCTLDTTDGTNGCGAGATCPSCCIFTSLTLKSGTTIECADQTAGFKARQQRCTGGTYAGAACLTNADCAAGSGTCDNDFGAADANPCTSSTCYAPTSGATYTMIRDENSFARGNTIKNCSFWTGQAEPYQRCTVGATPCRQECSSGSTFPGMRCEVDGDCSGGTCLNRADCDAGGGDCGGAPLSLVGPGKINPIDFARTTKARIEGVSVYDHFVGDFGLKTGDFAQVSDTNMAREITDCTSPLSSSPATSLCSVSTGAYAGTCCYGAWNLATSNVQPTTSVTNGIVVGTNSRVTGSTARGSTSGMTIGTQSRIDEGALAPISGRGPGTLTNGYVIGARSKIAKSFALWVKNGGIGIDLGTGAAAIENNVTFDSTATTGTGIKVGAAAKATANIVGDSNGNGALRGTQVGMQLASVNALIEGNYIEMGTTRPSLTTMPICILVDDGSYQGRIIANLCYGGWRGVTSGASTNSLTNVSIANNRFVSGYGAALALGGAGVKFQNNYVNLEPHLVCDPVCNTLAGKTCLYDTDCGTCTGATQKCIPEPIVWIGSPTAGSTNNWGTQHFGVANNDLFRASNVLGGAVKQCGGTTTNPGALCETAANTCNGGATCSSTGATYSKEICQSGSEVNKACCSGGAPTCTQRSPTPIVKLVEGSSTTTHSDLAFVGNTVFESFALSTWTNLVGFDMVGAGNIGSNLALDTAIIVANDFHGSPTSTGTVGLKWPVTYSSIADYNTNGNNFKGWATDVANYKGSHGEFNFVPLSVASSADTTTTATSYSNVTGIQLPVLANRTYNIRCDFIWQTNSTTSGIGLALSGPSSPTRFNYTFRASSSTTVGTDNEFVDYAPTGTDTDIGPSTSAAAASADIPAKIEGVLVTGANAGNITARVRGEQAGPTHTVKAGSNCVIYQVPSGS